MTVFSIAGGTQANSTTSGGKVTAINNLTTTPAQVIGLNPQRRRITFCNPSPTTLYVAPTVQASGAALVPSVSALGGCFPLVQFAVLVVEGECQVPWQAFMASGTGALTVMESNI